MGRLSGTRRYYPVDGGTGATVFALLPGADPRLHPAATPRDAGVLVVAEPVSRALVGALAESYRAAPGRPMIVLADEAPSRLHPGGPPAADLGDLFPEAARPPRVSTAGDLLARTHEIAALALSPEDRPRHVGRSDRALDPPREAIEPPAAAPVDRVPVPSPRTLTLEDAGKAHRDLATEELVMAIGPLQRITAGPLRLLLVLDGEQVVRAELDGGYAARNLPARLAASWSEALQLAEQIDPLAPIAGRLALVVALEQREGTVPPPGVRALRQGALALERALDALAWLTRFADLLADDGLEREARRCAVLLAPHLVPPAAIVPGGWGVAQAPDDSSRERALGAAAAQVARMAERVSGDRLLRLRTRGIGVLSLAAARAAGVTGPNLRASEHGAGDVQARMLERVHCAADDARLAAGTRGTSDERPDAPRGGDPRPAEGETIAHVDGPRGTIALTLGPDHTPDSPRVRWSRPSAAALSLVPDLIAHTRLADALAIVASLDLAMAEAEG